MHIVNFKATRALHTYATRGGDVSSDENGLISGIELTSQIARDLLLCGCVIDTTTAEASPSDPAAS